MGNIYPRLHIFNGTAFFVLAAHHQHQKPHPEPTWAAGSRFFQKAYYLIKN